MPKKNEANTEASPMTYETHRMPNLRSAIQRAQRDGEDAAQIPAAGEPQSVEVTDTKPKRS
jgi:hypothetical protein